MYTISERTEQDLQNRFTYHPPIVHVTAGNQAVRYEAIRLACLGLAERIARMTPSGREQSLAFTHLEEVVFWANAAIARGEVGEPQQ